MTNDVYGISLKFRSTDALVAAIRTLKSRGYSQLETFGPYGNEDIEDALKPPRSKLPLWGLIGGILGFFSGVALQYFTAVLQYPIVIAGRPLASWPAFVPVTFELTILGAALSIFVGFFVITKLPQPYHPFFNTPESGRASNDRFFLCLLAKDPQFPLPETRSLLERLGAEEVHLVPM